MRLWSVVIFCIVQIGCSTRMLDVKKPEDIATYFAKIESHNQRIFQIKASLDIKAYGVMANYVHEQADVMMQEPHFMYWSVRSFFGSPSMIIASNGEYLTTYDFSGQSAEPYQKTLLRPDTFFEVMDFRLHPRALMYLFMQTIPLEKARDVQFRTLDQALAIEAILDNDWRMRASYDLSSDRVSMIEFKNDVLAINYQAKYLDFQNLSGMDFPRSFVLSAKGKSRSIRLQIAFLHTELNGPSVLPDVFYVKPH